MDIFKLTILILLLLGFWSCGQAQEEGGELSKMMEEMSPEERAALMAFALEQADADLMKEMKRLLRQMDSEQREEVLEFAQEVEKRAYQYHFSRARSMRPKGQVQRIGDEQTQKAVEKRDASEGPFAEMTFEEKEYDFGEVVEGEQVRHEFVFTNTGEVPLLIREVKGSCGCTLPKWPSEPIPVGEQGTIEVLFNSEGKAGRERKSVSVFANTQIKMKRLFVIAEVVEEGK